MGLDPLKVSALVCGQLSGFSTDRLIRCLTQLGQDVEIVVRDKPRDHPKAHISVVTAADLEDLYLAEQRLAAVHAGKRVRRFQEAVTEGVQTVECGETVTLTPDLLQEIKQNAIRKARTSEPYNSTDAIPENTKS